MAKQRQKLQKYQAEMLQKQEQKNELANTTKSHPTSIRFPKNSKVALIAYSGIYAACFLTTVAAIALPPCTPEYPHRTSILNGAREIGSRTAINPKASGSWTHSALTTSTVCAVESASPLPFPPFPPSLKVMPCMEFIGVPATGEILENTANLATLENQFCLGEQIHQPTPPADLENLKFLQPCNEKFTGQEFLTSGGTLLKGKKSDSIIKIGRPDDPTNNAPFPATTIKTKNEGNLLALEVTVDAMLAEATGLRLSYGNSASSTLQELCAVNGNKLPTNVMLNDGCPESFTGSEINIGGGYVAKGKTPETIIDTQTVKDRGEITLVSAHIRDQNGKSSSVRFFTQDVSPKYVGTTEPEHIHDLVCVKPMV